MLFVASRVCQVPASTKPHTWPDDITQWPVRGHCTQHGIKNVYTIIDEQNISFSASLMKAKIIVQYLCAKTHCLSSPGLHTPQEVEPHRLQAHGL